MPGSPGTVGLQILLLAAVDVVNAAVQNQFRRAAFDLFQRNFAEHRNWILIQLPPAHGIQIAKKADAVVIPAPPQVARERPEALLRRSDEAVQSTRLADHGSDLVRSFYQHTDFRLAEDPRVFGLNDEHTLQNAPIDEGHAQKGVIDLFARF